MSRTRRHERNSTVAAQLPLTFGAPAAPPRRARGARPPQQAPRKAEPKQLALLGLPAERPLAQVVPFAPRKKAHASAPTSAQTAALAADEWYERGCDLEDDDVAAAVEAYGRALAFDPAHAATLLNVGRLHHVRGALALAEAAYRRALAVDPTWAVAAFNLGVALEDARKRDDAIAAYEQACAAERPCADAHYNVALLYERAGDRQAALRHLIAYRRLAR